MLQPRDTKYQQCLCICAVSLTLCVRAGLWLGPAGPHTRRGLAGLRAKRQVETRLFTVLNYHIFLSADLIGYFRQMSPKLLPDLLEELIVSPRPIAVFLGKGEESEKEEEWRMRSRKGRKRSRCYKSLSPSSYICYKASSVCVMSYQKAISYCNIA